MAEFPIFRGWDLLGRASRNLKRSVTGVRKGWEASHVDELADDVQTVLVERDLHHRDGRRERAERLAWFIIANLAAHEPDDMDCPLYRPLSECLWRMLEDEGLFTVPEALAGDRVPDRSELWAIEDQLRRTGKVLDHFNDAMNDLCRMVEIALAPMVEQHPSLIQPRTENGDQLRFSAALAENLADLPEIVEAMVQVPFAPELEKYDITARLKERLEYNLVVASGGVAGEPASSMRALKLPTKAAPMPAGRLIKTYLAGTPFASLFDCPVEIDLPQETRFEHQLIVAGSGHGKTQTLQHLILHDLEAVAEGRASIVVIDSQRDLIDNIAGLRQFGPGGPLFDRLVLIDPTDVEWPVALNLFDVGLDRLDGYSELDRERLINSILELYDFVLGSLLDAGMTQKQTVIFRYITRLLLHIPGATIHTLRELLEEGGYDRYHHHISKLEGSARAFFEHEFEGREFAQTKRQVLRRLYGILENQTFERMFSHPKSKLDLFSEMNAGKVILINTAKDLLKENGTEIFGRFFIAMIAQAAQERAVLAKEERLPTFVYIDEASDYFDRNIGIILSQARKYNIGMLAASQYLGQMDAKLQEAMAANTSIKFAGGVSAKDARALAAEMRTEPAFIEAQGKLSFAAFVKGSTKHAVSVSITPGQMEALARLSFSEKEAQRDAQRAKYAVHRSELAGVADEASDGDEEEPDDGRPMEWE